MDKREWFHRYWNLNDIRDYEDSYERLKYYERLPEVTLPAPTGMGQMASTPVPKQQSYTGKKPVISFTLADTLCSDLGIQGLLEKLNTILGTSFTMFTSSVYSVLEDCILQKWDFGTAYAYLRPF
ncbi:hypothetical protein ARMSODRAFT_1022753 [Armillaria solidipes]|uniref:Uncharacterized protein n=1 Tax=Armillaria solidipes TaxID=1076256 RepID=A0A2H3BJM6_9AGAR|nr:hypothetical protein ARMSODRAFT_1022753 [Armillaria solidipes]